MSKKTDTHKAFAAGYAFALGRKRARGKAQDDRWITVKPNGAEHKGRPALIDGEGNVKAGMGGKFNGQPITRTHRRARAANESFTSPQSVTPSASKSQSIQAQTQPAKPSAAPASTPAQAQTQAQGAAQIDLALPEKLDAKNILQNRDRSTVGSLQQVHSIAANPDFLRMGMSNDFANGAPVISYGTYKPEQLGRKSVSVTSDGTRYNVQYAVVDAGDVATSNDARGSKNEKYYSDDPNVKRAIAGNGRMTGITEAYRRGNADTYKQELMAASGEHGVSPDVISKMKAPVLVRVMQPKDVTADIGDKSNTQSNLQLSAVEQAKNDTNRINFADIDTYSDGSPKKNAVLNFVHQMPVSEQGNLLDANGQPTKQAQERMQNAIFAKAYQDDRLLDQAAQAWDPESKTLTNALMRAAPKVQRLEGLPDGYDVRGLISKAVSRAYKAFENGDNLQAAAGQTDMFESQTEDTATRELIKMFANSKSAKEIGDKLNKMADYLYAEANKPKFDLFGAVETIPRDVLIKKALSQDAAFCRMSGQKLYFWYKYGGKIFANIFRH